MDRDHKRGEAIVADDILAERQRGLAVSFTLIDSNHNASTMAFVHDNWNQLFFRCLSSLSGIVFLIKIE